MKIKTMNILVISSIYPNAKNQSKGVFVRNRIVALAKYSNVKVISPVTWFPFLSLIRKYKGAGFRVIPPRNEVRDAIEVSYPRVFSFPLIFKSLDALFFFFAISLEMIRSRRSFKPDIIHAHFVYPVGVASYFVSRLFGLPLIISERGIIHQYQKGHFLIRKQIRLLLRGAEKVICVSNELKEIVLKSGAGPDKVVVIPNGVDLKRFFIKDTAQARRKLNLPLDGKIVLSVGHLCVRKGFPELVSAISEIRGRNVNAKICLYIVGGSFPNEDTSKELEKLIKESGLQETVFLAGDVPNEILCDWYNAADVFCLFSNEEGCPNVVLEAFACGIPVVLNDMPAFSELLVSSDLGIKVEAKNSNSAADGLLSALEKKWDRSLIRKHVENRSWENVALTEYKEIAGCLNKNADLKSQKE